jgi:hypothetical protein
MTSAIAEDTRLAVHEQPPTSEETIATPPEDVAYVISPTPLPSVADPTAVATAPLAAPAADDNQKEDDDEDVMSSLERDHPSFAQATISLIVQLLPEDGHADGRLALIAVKSHNLIPLTTMHRMGTLETLPHPLSTLLQQWDTTLPEALSQRALARAQEQEVQRLKEVERKAQRAATKRPDIKKTEKPKPNHTRTDNPIPTAETAPTSPVPIASQPDLF